MQPTDGSPLRRSKLREVLRVAIPLIILTSGISGFLALGSRPPESRTKTETILAPVVQTVAVAAHERGLDIEIDGTVVPHRQLELSAEIPGRIASKAKVCKSGTFVTKGTVLFEIDARDYELEVRRLQEELKQADAALREFEVELTNTEAQIRLAEEELELQRKNLARLTGLAGKKVASEAEIDVARREELAARNSLQSLRNQTELWKPRRARAEQQRELATVQLEKAQLDLQRTKVVAPIDGTIVSDPIEADAFVEKGELLAKINDTSCAEVKCSLKMEELYWLWKQQEGVSTQPKELGIAAQYEIPRTPVTVAYALGGNEYRWEGVLSRFEGAGLDEKTRTAPCRVLVASPRDVSMVEPSGATRKMTTGPRALVSGMFVTVMIHSQPEAALLRIPAKAVRPGNVVWKAREGKLSIEPVHIIEARGDDVILHAAASNLAAGDSIIVSPLPVVNSGMAVREQTL